MAKYILRFVTVTDCMCYWCGVWYGTGAQSLRFCILYQTSVSCYRHGDGAKL